LACHSLVFCFPFVVVCLPNADVLLTTCSNFCVPLSYLLLTFCLPFACLLLTFYRPFAWPLLINCVFCFNNLLTILVFPSPSAYLFLICACVLLSFCLQFSHIVLTFCLPSACLLLTICLPFNDLLLTFCLRVSCRLLTLCLPFAYRVLTFCLPFASLLLICVLPSAYLLLTFPYLCLTLVLHVAYFWLHVS